MIMGEWVDIIGVISSKKEFTVYKDVKSFYSLIKTDDIDFRVNHSDLFYNSINRQGRYRITALAGDIVQVKAQIEYFYKSLDDEKTVAVLRNKFMKVKNIFGGKLKKLNYF